MSALAKSAGVLGLPIPTMYALSPDETDERHTRTNFRNADPLPLKSRNAANARQRMTAEQLESDVPTSVVPSLFSLHVGTHTPSLLPNRGVCPAGHVNDARSLAHGSEDDIVPLGRKILKVETKIRPKLCNAAIFFSKARPLKDRDSFSASL